MLATDSFRHQHTFAEPVNMDQGMRNSYSEMVFNDYSSYAPNLDFSNLPYSYYDSHLMAVEAPSDPMVLRKNPYLKADAYPTAEHPPSTLSSASAPSIRSATSSTVGSPYPGPAQPMSYQDTWGATHPGLGIDPTVVTHDNYNYDFGNAGFEPDVAPEKTSRDVDPNLIQSQQTSSMHQTQSFAGESMYPHMSTHAFTSYSPVPSPALSQHALPVSTYPGTQFVSAPSPQLQYNSFEPAFARPGSAASVSEHSYRSHQSPVSASFETDEEGRQKGRCPNQDCGKFFKDLKAHMLTHQSERPEKCPILTCEYNQKGFARKYDKNRHTLTHYKGTMVCGFCPGSGSAAEKSFNRADVFKRHLTSVHGVEQTAPNSRKRSPGSNKILSNYCQDATGKCSTCSATFNNAQDFYEHLDDCVLRVVQQEEPSEAINQHHLTSISADDAVKETLDRHMLTQSDPLKTEDQDEDDDEDDDDEDDEDFVIQRRTGRSQARAQKGASSSRVVLGNNSAITKNKGIRKGMTISKGGVPIIGKGRKKRKHYPPSWGMSPDKMKMKKRVLCVYDGERRLWKDDMMLDNEFEVRMKLSDGKSYVTDLDVETLKRANALHNATEEERGPLMPEEGTLFDLDSFMA